PYQGRVLDAETKEPIHGAVVVAVWEEKVYRVYRNETILSGIMEVKTNREGEFEIPGFVEGPLKNDFLGMQPPRFYIFKSGYGSYPKSHVKPWENFEAHFTPFSFVELPRLKTSYERRLVQVRTDRLKQIPSEYIPMWRKELAREDRIVQSMEDENGRANTWADGTFYGRVVDEETGAAIEGAVVLSIWWNQTGGEGRTVLSVKETMTRQDGTFSLPGYKDRIFSKGPIGVQPPEFYVFKPGYASFPGPAETPAKLFRVQFRPFTETVGLKRLEKGDERAKDLYQLEILADVPLEEAPRFLRLLNEERGRIGLRPVRVAQKPNPKMASNLFQNP
ncbi:MAG TPA: carboxypeptidase-like regulatory domain-containing protein, partial [Nitrospiria bacterium]|nr:carboxypeptidase-like regulatory domain-containing protein [Nitrospiria bacterium]